MRQYLEQVSGKRWLVTVLVFIGFISGVFLIRYIASNPSPTLFNKKEEPVKATPVQPQIDAKKIAEGIKAGQTFEQAKKENPGAVTNPNAGIKEVKDQIADLNPDPVLQEIIYNGQAFTPVNLTIRQGDFVTWKNNSKADLMIKGNDWGTFLPIAVAKSFTQTFDFKGRYPYTDTDGTISGVVVVE